MELLLSYVCMQCKNLQSANIDTEQWECDAFPDGIPAEIAQEKVDHFEPYEDDNGIQFEEREE